jgi:aspartate aminotransferase-like enzyme
MPGLLPEIDPDGLLEYSVVFSDRSLNHMSASFQQVMRDISATLSQLYGARGVAVVPGGGTYAMEAVVRQLARDQRVLVLRNGWFSYRWTQILETLGYGPHAVLKARTSGPGRPFSPAPLDEVLAHIASQRPGLVFAPHVETSAGMLLPEDYLRAVGEATRAVGGLFVLDCIASGALWLDMGSLSVDVLLSAPQKGWSGTPCAGLVMLGDRALERVEASSSDSFAVDLRRWLGIMRAYEAGGHAYHATLPTDGLVAFHAAMNETRAFGFSRAREAQIELGARVRSALEAAGYPSVAAPGFQAPGVVVSYTSDPEVHTGAAFKAHGVQIAKGVPLACDEPEDFRTFRVGLFGLDKLADVDGAVARFVQTL